MELVGVVHFFCGCTPFPLLVVSVLASSTDAVAASLFFFDLTFLSVLSALYSASCFSGSLVAGLVVPLFLLIFGLITCFHA